MSNQHTGLPNTLEEIRAFIGMQFSSLQFGQENEQPHENDTYTLTAHDLISAFQGLEIDAPVSAEPVAFINHETLNALLQDPKRLLAQCWLNPKKTGEDDTALYATTVTVQEKEEAARYRWLRDRNDWHAEPRLDAEDGTIWRLTFYTPAPIIDPTDDDNLDVALIAAMLADACGSTSQRPIVAAQPDVTQQTLDDVKAGIPARDAEIAALRKEIQALQSPQAQQPGPPAGFISIDAYDRLHALCESQAERLLAIDDMQQPVSGTSQRTEANNRRKALLENQGKGEVPSWTGHGDADAALIMLDRLDVSGGDNDRVNEISAIIRNLAAKQDQFRDVAQMIEPSGYSGELPELTIQWHDTPEAVHRIFWEKAAIENGLTYEELIEGAMVGETEGRQKVDLTYEQEIQAIRDQKCWGCADTDTNQIHVWAAPDVDHALLIHMLAHEIGHLTGEPHPDDIQEELRAETFGKVAALAYHMLPSSQDINKVHADPLQGAADWLVKDCGVSDPAGLANRLGIGYNRACRLVDAARKEPGQ